MEQFYEAIENKIKQAGYNEFVNGEEIYNEIFMSKKDDDTFFEYKIDIMAEEFNLSYIIINTKDKKYKVDFDN